MKKSDDGSDGANLLAAVLASPDDDAPRLVYADWLLERGDVRGEFIQIQIALGRSLHGARGIVWGSDPNAKDPPSREELEKREKALLNKHQKDWLKPIRRYIRTWEWKRGFVDRVEADGASFLDGVATIMSETPLFHAELTGLKPTVFPRFDKASAFRALRSLKLSQQRINAKTANVFLSPHWCGLRELELYGNPLKDAGIAILATAEHFDVLEMLHVASTDMLLPGLDALTKAPYFARLKDFDMDTGYDRDGSKACGPDAAACLVRGESLVTLSLTGCKLGDDGAKKLAASPALANLETLALHGNDIGNDGAMALIASKHLKKLKNVTGLLSYGSRIKDKSKAAVALRERFGTDVD